VTDTLAVRAVAVALCRLDDKCCCQHEPFRSCFHAIAAHGQNAARIVKGVSGNASGRPREPRREALKALPPPTQLPEAETPPTGLL
jgi:hypothetical protein